jgi:hypothetical protein
MYQVGPSFGLERGPKSAETSDEELLIARQWFCNQGYVDGVGYKTKAADNWENKYLGYRGTGACIR